MKAVKYIVELVEKRMAREDQLYTHRAATLDIKFGRFWHDWSLQHWSLETAVWKLLLIIRSPLSNAFLSNLFGKKLRLNARTKSKTTAKLKSEFILHSSRAENSLRNRWIHHLLDERNLQALLTPADGNEITYCLLHRQEHQLLCWLWITAPVTPTVTPCPSQLSALNNVSTCQIYIEYFPSIFFCVFFSFENIPCSLPCQFL